jgi:hypothetical protein
MFACRPGLPRASGAQRRFLMTLLWLPRVSLRDFNAGWSKLFDWLNGRFGEIEMDAMMDVVFVSLIVGFFGASAWLVHFCAGLLGDKGGLS